MHQGNVSELLLAMRAELEDAIPPWRGLVFYAAMILEQVLDMLC